MQLLETQEFMLGGFYYDWRDNQKPFVAMTAETATTSECDLTERDAAQTELLASGRKFFAYARCLSCCGTKFPAGRRSGRAARRSRLSLMDCGLTHYNRDPGILNKTIDIDGKPVRVVGVLPKDFEMPRLQAADVLFPMATNEAR